MFMRPGGQPSNPTPVRSGSEIAMTENPPRSANLPPGFDEEDPYASVDLSTLPDWWRRNIEEFREHEMRPYRPPRFVDGELTVERIVPLEAELGVDIRFRALNPQSGGSWELTVDGEPVVTVSRRREGEGFTRYDITADEFEAAVRSAISG